MGSPGSTWVYYKPVMKKGLSPAWDERECCWLDAAQGFLGTVVPLIASVQLGIPYVGKLQEFHLSSPLFHPAGHLCSCCWTLLLALLLLTCYLEECTQDKSKGLASCLQVLPEVALPVLPLCTGGDIPGKCLLFFSRCHCRQCMGSQAECFSSWDKIIAEKQGVDLQVHPWELLRSVCTSCCGQ